MFSSDVFVSDTIPASAMLFGSTQVTFGKGEDHKCVSLSYTLPFAPGEVKVQMTVASDKCIASVAWAENVTTTA